MVALRDRLQLSPNIVFLPKETVPLLALFDGRYSLRDIQEILTRESGEITLMDFVEKLVASLDKVFLLYGPRFEDTLKGKVEEYARQRSDPLPTQETATAMIRMPYRPSWTASFPLTAAQVFRNYFPRTVVRWALLRPILTCVQGGDPLPERITH